MSNIPLKFTAAYVAPFVTPDEDYKIQGKIEDLGGEVVNTHHWSMYVTLPVNRVGDFLAWAIENKSLFQELEFTIAAWED